MTNAKENMVINSKTSKQEILDFLIPISTAKKSEKTLEKGLFDRIKYTVKKATEDLKNVSKNDLLSLVDELTNAIPAVVQKQPVEASAKPKLAAKKTEEKKEAVKPAKVEVKKDIETVAPVSQKGTDSLPIAAIFPEEIDHPDLGKLIACNDEYTGYDQIVKALEAGRTLYFACYWTSRQIKQFDYEGNFQVTAPKNGFPFNLDMALAVVPCESIKRLFCLSRYTEAMYKFNEDEFKYISEVDPRGDGNAQFKVRVSVGMEYEIYRPEDEAIEK